MTLTEIIIRKRSYHQNGVDIKISKEFVTILEDGLSHQNLLKSGFVPDKIVMDQNKNIFLLRDEDRYEDYLSLEDVKKSYNSTIDDSIWKNETFRSELENYYKMILDKMISYDRDSKIDIIFESEFDIEDQLI
jgi:hypothetical protein